MNNYHKAAGIHHLVHTRANEKPETQTRYACKAHNQQIDRYQAGNLMPADKVNKETKQSAVIKDKKSYSNEPISYHLDQKQQMVPVSTANKLQLVSNNKDPLSLHQDQLQKQVVNTIREVPEQFFEDLKHVIPVNDKLSIFRKHIPKQREIDALLANWCKRVLHNLMINLDTKDLIEAYDTSTRYRDIYHYVQEGRLSGNNKMQKKIVGEANSYVTINDLLFKIVQYKESGKWVHYLPLFIPEKYEAHIMNMYHNSLVAMHQGPYKTFLTIQKQFHFPNMLPKLQRYIEVCTICQRSKPKRTAQCPYYGRIPVDYVPCKNLAVDLKSMLKGFLNYEHLLIATCEKTNFVYAIPLQNKKTQTIADALIHRVFLLMGPPTKLSIDQDSALTSQVITEVLKSLECTMQIISPWNRGSSKAERQIQTIGNMISKHLSGKGSSWPLYAAMSAYSMNTFASNALQGLSPFELVFARKLHQLTSFEMPKLQTIEPKYREFFKLLMDKVKMYRDMDLEWHTVQALELHDKNKMLTNIETFVENDIVYLLAPHMSALQSNAQKFRQDYVGP